MARIVSLDCEIENKLRNYILGTLRVSDEAVVLPQASRSTESGALKNTVLRLNGSEAGISPEVLDAFFGYRAMALTRLP